MPGCPDEPAWFEASLRRQVNHSQVQCFQAGWVGNDLDVVDLVVLDREADHSFEASSGSEDRTYPAVYQGGRAKGAKCAKATAPLARLCRSKITQDQIRPFHYAVEQVEVAHGGCHFEAL